MINDNLFSRLFIFYFLILVSIYFIGDLAFKLNPVFLVCFSFIIFITKLSKTALIKFIIFMPFLIFVTINTQIHRMYDVLHFLQDLVMTFFIISMCEYISKESMSIRIQKQVCLFSLLYIFLYLISAFDISRYDSELGVPRYNGITGSTNISSTTFVLLLVYFWEYLKANKLYGKVLFIFFVALYSLVVYISKSRSLLFLAPYIFIQIYIIYHRVYQKIIISIFISILVFILYLNIDIIFENLRISSDSSFNTRGKISEVILDKIKENYFFFPYGHNTGNIFLANYLNEERYPIHNDFLKILYEWGISGIIFIIMTLGNLALKLKNINNILILFFAISAALHNVLFFFYIWMPLLLIFGMKNAHQNQGKNYEI